MKNVILLALVVVFNEFIASLLLIIATLLIKIGGAIQQIPEIF